MRVQVGEGPNGKMPVYALWMLEVCLREPTPGGEGGVVETFVRCGGLDQVGAENGKWDTEKIFQVLWKEYGTWKTGKR